MAIDIDEAKVNRNEVGLWTAWTLATAAAMLLGQLTFIFLIDRVDLLVLRILIPLWTGFLVGVFQWLVLRPYLTHSVDWILHGGAGWALGFALGLVIIQALAASPVGIIIGYLLFGAIIALVQWPVLHREIPNIGTWVIANIIGWALGSFLGQVILNAVVTGDTISQVTSSAVIAGITGLVAGAVTGLALVWIVRKPEIPEVS
jgi:hypothetical protein